MAERRSVVGAEGLAAEASRKSTRRKLHHPLTIDKKAEKVRVETERRNVAGAAFLVAEATRKSAHQMQLVIDKLGSLLSKKQKQLELRPKDGMRKVHKLQLFN